MTRIQDHQIHPEFFGLIAESSASATERLSGDGGATFHPIHLTEEMFAAIVYDIEHWFVSEDREYENLDEALRDLFFRQHGHKIAVWVTWDDEIVSIDPDRTGQENWLPCEKVRVLPEDGSPFWYGLWIQHDPELERTLIEKV